MDWLGIGIIVVVGLALVAIGIITDRRKTSRQVEAMTAPPRRDIPGLDPKSAPPAYLGEAQARTRPAHALSTELSTSHRDDVRSAIKQTAPIPAGYPDSSWITDPPTGWAVLDHPLILVCDDPIETMRELLTPIERAKREGHPLVLVAPAFNDEVIDTLRANLVQGTFPGLPLTVVSAAGREVLCQRVQARPVSRDDLRSGYLDPNALGVCQTWIADAHQSWAIPS